MNKKWLGRKSHLDTNSLQVEWLGAEDTKQDDRGSSAGGVFRVKNRLTCDLQCATVWLSSGASPGIKFFFLFFQLIFWLS